MDLASDARSFVLEPLGRALVGRRHVLWSDGPRRAGTVVWGDFDLEDARAITTGWDYEARLDTPYGAVVDLARLAHVELRAFAAIEADMRRRLPVLARRIRRQALVRPAGWVGSMVSGFYPVLAPTFRWRVFTRADEAYAWALGSEGPRLAREVDAIVREACADDELARVRAVVREAIDRELTLVEVAKRVGRSARSVQRALAAAGTSFRAEASRLRVERARELLEGTELKIELVARAVGVRSPTSFVAMFRAATGTSPSAYRSARNDLAERPGGRGRARARPRPDR